MYTHTHARIYVHIETHTYACVCSETVGTVWDCLSPLQLFTFLFYSWWRKTEFCWAWTPPQAQDCWEKYQWPQICKGWYHPYGRKWRRTKEPLDESERGEWKSWLKTQHSENEDHGIRSHHFMANRWGNSDRLYFLGGSKISADGDCSHEIKRRLLLRRKIMTNLDSILKSKDSTLPTRVLLVKAMVF